MVPSAYEEPSPERHPDPAAFAEHLAAEKARDVARSYPGHLVVGADTVVAMGDRLYGKPADPDDVVRMLMELSGRTHTVFTGVALVQGSAVVAFNVRTEVTFRSLMEAEARAYAATGEPMDKAGAYGIQRYGMLLIEKVHGDYPNVVGLPLVEVALRLRARGYPVLGLPVD